ncbi:MAG: hypothetical protein H7Y17_11530 [Chlorobia bacterium]|nr:hypothetical protein [Fimbriimonadaceae bacterium]
MQADQAKRVGKKLGCGVCGCLTTIPVFVGAIVYFTVFSNFCARIMGEETHSISGDPKRFDPVAAIPEVRAKVGSKAILVSFNATSVRSDGTMDLNATYSPAPSADYSFVVPLDKAPEDQTAPPIGAGRGPDDVWIQRVSVKVYQPGQRRHVSRSSGSSRSSYSYTNEGMDVDRHSPRMEKLEKGVTDLKLTPKQMWEIAGKLDANKEAVATIKFAGDHYEFDIVGTDIHLRWDGSGKLQHFWLKDHQKRKLGIEDN